LAKLADRLRFWLRRERSKTVPRDVGRLSEEGLIDLADECATWLSHSDVVTLIERSYARLHRNPLEAVALARAAVVFADRMRGEPLSRADAWRQYALSLVDRGEYAAAIRAADQAGELYAAVHPPAAMEKALLALTRGRALCYLGNAEEALLVIAWAAAVLKPLNRRKYVGALTMHANALLAMSSFTEAAAIFEEAALLARDDNDVEALAAIINNMGLCYANVGQTESARRYLDTALVHLRALGLKAEIPRNRTAFVKVLICEGRYNRAISELFEIRRIFLDELSMPVLAADTGLWLLDLLYKAGRARDVPGLAQELITIFRSKDLPLEANKAFAYLGAATIRGLRKDDVLHVRGFVARLLSSPGAIFSPPS
jgi:tetratricopeptide (TPR) repeat protein